MSANNAAPPQPAAQPQPSAPVAVPAAARPAQDAAPQHYPHTPPPQPAPVIRAPDTGLGIILEPPEAKLRAKFMVLFKQPTGHSILHYMRRVTKISSKGKAQPRVLLVSNTSVYLTDENAMVKRCIPIVDIGSVEVARDGRIAFRVPEDKKEKKTQYDMFVGLPQDGDNVAAEQKYLLNILQVLHQHIHSLSTHQGQKWVKHIDKRIDKPSDFTPPLNMKKPKGYQPYLCVPTLAFDRVEKMKKRLERTHPLPDLGGVLAKKSTRARDISPPPRVALPSPPRNEEHSERLESDHPLLKKYTNDVVVHEASPVPSRGGYTSGSPAQQSSSSSSSAAVTLPRVDMVESATQADEVMSESSRATRPAEEPKTHTTFITRDILHPRERAMREEREDVIRPPLGVSDDEYDNVPVLPLSAPPQLPQRPQPPQPPVPSADAALLAPSEDYFQRLNQNQNQNQQPPRAAPHYPALPSGVDALLAPSASYHPGAAGAGVLRAHPSAAPPPPPPPLQNVSLMPPDASLISAGGSSFMHYPAPSERASMLAAPSGPQPPPSSPGAAANAAASAAMMETLQHSVSTMQKALDRLAVEKDEQKDEIVALRRQLDKRRIDAASHTPHTAHTTHTAHTPAPSDAGCNASVAPSHDMDIGELLSRVDGGSLLAPTPGVPLRRGLRGPLSARESEPLEPVEESQPMPATPASPLSPLNGDDELAKLTEAKAASIAARKQQIEELQEDLSAMVASGRYDEAAPEIVELRQQIQAFIKDLSYEAKGYELGILLDHEAPPSEANTTPSRRHRSNTPVKRYSSSTPRQGSTPRRSLSAQTRSSASLPAGQPQQPQYLHNMQQQQRTQLQQNGTEGYTPQEMQEYYRQYCQYYYAWYQAQQAQDYVGGVNPLFPVSAVGTGQPKSPRGAIRTASLSRQDTPSRRDGGGGAPTSRRSSPHYQVPSRSFASGRTTPRSTTPNRRGSSRRTPSYAANPQINSRHW